MADAPEEPRPPPPGPLEQVRRGAAARAGLIAEGLLLVAAFSWMLWVRLRSLDRMVQDGTVYFTGTDPYYHFRNLLVALNEFPGSLAFDPWTYFPHGTASGQFGTLFETLLAGAIIVGNGGVPDVYTARLWAAVYPAILGALTVLPVYAVVRRATNRVGAAYAAVAVAFLSGEFLARSLAGNFDHHVAEALLSAAAAAGLLAAVAAARRHVGILEALWSPAPEGWADLRDRWADVDGRSAGAVLAWTAWAGLLLATYLLVWNYGVLFVLVFDLFALLAFLAAVRVGRPTDVLALGLAPAFAAAAVLTLLGADTLAFDLHTQSLLQPALLLLSALGVLVLQGLRALAGRLADDGEVAGVDLGLEAVPRGLLYAGLAAGATLLGAGLVAVLLPDLYTTLVNGWTWVAGADEGSRVKTIAEARTLGWSGLVSQVSSMAYPAAVALAVAAWRVWEDADPAPCLFLAWGGVILLATINQVRFAYYAGVATVVLNGYLVGELAEMTGLANRVREALPDARDPDDRLADRAGTATQLATVLLVAFFLLPGLVVATDDRPSQAWKVGKGAGPGEAREWQPGLVWMRANTPETGAFDLNTSHEEHPGYGDDAYGVLSWWDYGHWIQLTGRRAPVANPFQQGAPFASQFFTSEPARSNELLRDWEGDERVRYVVIDDAMATGKFGAITVWAERQGLNRPDANRTYTIQGQKVDLPVQTEYYNTTLARLYFDDADGMGHYRLVHELTGGGQFRFVGNVLQVGEQSARIVCLHQTFPSRSCRVQPAGGDVLGKIEADEPIRVQSLDGQDVGYAWDVSYVSTLKTFERVEGALLTGEAPPGSTVTANLTLRSDDFRTFQYTRETTLDQGDGNRSYELRVAYASGDPVDEANRTVRAPDPYTVTVTGPDGTVLAEHQVPVPDRAVLDGERVAVAGR